MALRDEPTLTHFDPDRMTWYVTSGGKGQAMEFHRPRALPQQTAVAWGHVNVVDRLEVQNAFLTFGGVLRAAQVDPGTTVVVLDSPAPILRWSGHSQDVDLMAPQVAAFFARLMVPIDFAPGAEARIASLSPMALYAAFVARRPGTVPGRPGAPDVESPSRRVAHAGGGAARRRLGRSNGRRGNRCCSTWSVWRRSTTPARAPTTSRASDRP